MVHTAVGYARMANRLRAFACTTSVGPGATNMVTGAAVATTNRIPVLLLPGDVFATRRANPVLARTRRPDVTSTSRSTTRYVRCRITSTASGDRSNFPVAMLHAMRVLTDPAETGAVTLALPEDVQTEAFDFADDLFDPRVWHVRRPPPDAGLDRTSRRTGASSVASAHRRRRRRHLQRGHRRAALDSSSRHGNPRRRDPGRQGLAALRPPREPRGHRRDRDDRRQRHRARRRPRDRHRHTLERLHHGVTFGVSKSRRQDRQHQRDALRHAQALGCPDRRRRARSPRTISTRHLGDWRVDDGLRERLPAARTTVERSRRGGLPPRPPTAARPERGYRRGRGVDQRPRRDRRCGRQFARRPHKLWRTRDPKGYHVEYAFSCMGYEIAADLA